MLSSFLTGFPCVAGALTHRVEKPHQDPCAPSCREFFAVWAMDVSVLPHRSLCARKSVFEIVVYTGTHETSITCASTWRGKP